MAVCKMFQAAIGLLYLGHVLLGHASFGFEGCAVLLPSDAAAKIGEKVTFQCVLNSENIAWTFCPRGAGPYVLATNCNLVSSAIENYRLDKSHNACDLVIDNVTTSHYGTYTCQDLALNDHGHSAELRYPSNENVALHKKTIQSTTNNNWGANVAVDGDTNGNVNHGSCSCTEAVAPAWWAVDLGQETPIGRVRITNRGDCCPERLQKFFIGLTNISPFTTAPNLNQSSICKYYTGIPPGGVPTDICCEHNTKPGRYLFIYIERAEYLTLCEVEAYYE